jgi:hypothetical protein
MNIPLVSASASSLPITPKAFKQQPVVFDKRSTDQAIFNDRALCFTF